MKKVGSLNNFHTISILNYFPIGMFVKEYVTKYNNKPVGKITEKAAVGVYF